MSLYRTGELPWLCMLSKGPSGVGPEQVALQVEGDEAEALEEGVQALAVGDRRGGGEAGVAVELGDGGEVQRLLPQQGAGVGVVAQHQTASGRCRAVRKQAVAPDDGGGVAVPRDLATCQATFSVALQWSGRPRQGERPEPSPRKPGQLSPVTSTTGAAKTTSRSAMTISGGLGSGALSLHLVQPIIDFLDSPQELPGIRLTAQQEPVHHHQALHLADAFGYGRAGWHSPAASPRDTESGWSHGTG